MVNYSPKIGNRALRVKEYLGDYTIQVKRLWFGWEEVQEIRGTWVGDTPCQLTFKSLTEAEDMIDRILKHEQAVPTYHLVR